MSGKEIAKFFSGFAADQVFTHGTFVAAGVQFSLFGITCDKQLNGKLKQVLAVKRQQG